MTDYTKLVADLRDTERVCRDRMDGQVMLDAADAIEDLQDTVQAQDKALKECARQLAKMGPKRGKWIWIQKENGGQYKGCSVCHAPIPTDSMLDYLDDEDCDFCYSCGAKMEVQE